MLKRLLSLVLVLCVLSALPGCGKNEPVPSDTILSFQNAFNRYDLDGMLDCVEPSLAETVRNLLGSESSGYSVKYSLVLALLKLGFPVMPLLTHGAIGNDDLPKLHITCNEAEEENNTAVVPTDGTLTIGDGSLSFSVAIQLRRDDNGNWYISGLKKAEDTGESLASDIPQFNLDTQNLI